ncbi:MAG: Sua5/YciO/YrdC/YwlC family protein, partial [Muribaculaceae bacterium]|nr:Sua5/YciO/YrdC/YwlC family protein [Muribaculaceae bacterium]
MRTIKIWNDSPAENQLNEITDALEAGQLVILPTDSVYAITCDALNIKAINQLCKLKGLNPDRNHLSIICSDISMAAEYTRISNTDFNLLKHNTPGPFTFLLPAGHQLPKAFKG